MTKDLIVGIHSIGAALANVRRSDKKLYATKDGLSRLGKVPNFCEVETLSSHRFQQKAQELYAREGFHWQRIPGGLLLEAAPLELAGVAMLYSHLEQGKVDKILCLDQVTDIHNAAAILRTCAFYSVPFVVLEKSGNFGLSPSFFRLASGATEHVHIAPTGSLPRTLGKLKEKGVRLIGLSESAETNLREVPRHCPSCLILGAEERGLSHAVQRCLDECAALVAPGPIKSLNVSVAAALAMDSFWGP